MALPMGIEPTSPEKKSGYSLAVELRGDQMDKWRDRTEALQCRESNPDRQGFCHGRYALLIGGG